MKRALATLGILAVAAPATAALKTETVKYKAGDTELVGYLAYDDAARDKRPGVLVVHEWWGLNDHAKRKADALAQAGYVAFALDMYGGGKVTPHPEEAGQWSSAVGQNREVARQRFMAAHDLLSRHARVQAGQVGAIGYCFGGSVVLGMAMAGADLDGVVSFHGGLLEDPVAPGTQVKAKILVCNGAADPMVTPDTIQKFQRNLDAAGADWVFINYSGAKHSFTNPEAAKAGIDALVYHEQADRRSWRAMLDFFGEIYGGK
jgi:dienelactone hydrolase